MDQGLVELFCVQIIFGSLINCSLSVEKMQLRVFFFFFWEGKEKMQLMLTSNIQLKLGIFREGQLSTLVACLGLGLFASFKSGNP